MTSRPQARLALLIAALAGTMALAACDRTETAGADAQQADRTVAQNEQPSATARESAGETPAGAAADELRQDGRELSARAADAVSDAAITTGVKAELAKDDTLSALDINVDTAAGHVALRGSAPSQVSRERATQLAAAVEGVLSVDNQLKLEAKQ